MIEETCDEKVRLMMSEAIRRRMRQQVKGNSVIESSEEGFGFGIEGMPEKLQTTAL